MADSLTLLRKSMNMLQHMHQEDLRAIKLACERKRLEVKGERSIKTLENALTELDRLLS